MAINATVREWHTEDGWGVLDSPATPGGCWAHFGSAAVAGAADFAPGDGVWLDWETVGDQDGYRFRATRFWPQDTAPVERTGTEAPAAYHSTLTFHFDEPTP